MAQVEQRVRVDHILSLRIPNMDSSPALFQNPYSVHTGLLLISCVLKLCSSEHCPWNPAPALGYKTQGQGLEWTSEL